MMPKGGEVGMKTAQETSRVATTQAHSPAALPDMEGWLQFARGAEEAGIESVLLSFSRYEPDTIFVACALGQVTTKLGFIVAYRLGLMQPATFVQQINTLSGLIGGRDPRRLLRGPHTNLAALRHHPVKSQFHLSSIPPGTAGGTSYVA